MNPKWFLFLFLLLSIKVISQVTLDDKKLEKRLISLQEITKTVGFSVAIIKEDKVIYSRGFGYKDLENKLKVDENTLFPIGSTSKAFTTALLGLMEEEKELNFNDSPKKYLPELEFYNDDLNNKVTILDMISHRTGLPRHDFSWYLFPTESKDSLLHRVKYHEPFTGMRETWYYNNFMYLAQGLIIEKLTGKSWEHNIRERFFKPLNMDSSNLTIKELESHDNISKGYSLENFISNKPMPYYNISAISPAGSINSSAKEMANWLKIWLNEGLYNNEQVLPKKYVEKAMNPLMLVGTGIADKQFPDQHLNSYGYAWFISSYKGHYRLEHGGNIDGFSANVAMFPNDKIGIVVLANQNGSLLPSLVRNAIADEILNLNRTDWVSYYSEKEAKYKLQLEEKKKSQKDSKVQNTKPSHSMAEYSGKYHHKGYGDFRIEVKNDSLWANFTREKAFLLHKHYDVFIPYLVKDNKVDLNEDLGFNFNFQTNDNGDIANVKLKLEPTIDALTFERRIEEVAVSKDTLNNYIGTYLLSGLEIQVYFKTERLMLFVPGQPEYSLTPIAESEFIIKGLSGYKVQFLQEHDVKSLVLHQPNGIFTAKMK
ncbi:serine hydrolase [Mariniflexile sp.]|uniref:serine hydrolase n=1 Tax=Mariniflexile sp. TaxID=1979402 RepID=UPI0035640A21